MCLDCHSIFTFRRAGENPEDPTCRNCTQKCMLLTDPGAWGPTALQEMYPGKEPSDLESIRRRDEKQSDELRQLWSQFGILCPNCHNLTMQYECRVLWD